MADGSMNIHDREGRGHWIAGGRGLEVTRVRARAVMGRRLKRVRVRRREQVQGVERMRARLWARGRD